MKSPDKTPNPLPGVAAASRTYQDCVFPPPGRSTPVQHEPSLSETLATLYSSPGEGAQWAKVFDQLCDLTSSTVFLTGFNPRPGQQALDVRGADYDLHHLAILPLVNASPHLDGLKPWRDGNADEFDAEILHLLQCGVPHVRVAQLLRRELAAANLRAARAEAALEHTTAAAFLLDSVGRIVYMNRSAEEILSSADGLMLRRNKVIATNPTQQSKLRLLIGAAIASAQTSPPSPAGAIALERRSGHRPLFVRVLPLRVDLERGQMPPGHALLLIADPDVAVKDPTDFLKDLFSLTTAEIEVAVSLRAGLSLTEIAAARRVSIETVRSQIKSILQKTNTRRQGDLILLLTTLIT